MVKRFYYDLETTALDPKLGAIHQMAGRLEIDGKIVEEFNLKLKPFRGALVESDALKTCNVTMEDLKEYPHYSKAYDSLIEILSRYCNKFDKKDKFTMVGYNNSKFDNEFLREFFMKNEDSYFGSWFWPNSIDVYSIASLFLELMRPGMVNFKLATVAKCFGIDVDEEKLHDAMYDIELTSKILRIAENRLGLKR